MAKTRNIADAIEADTLRTDTASRLFEEPLDYAQDTSGPTEAIEEEVNLQGVNGDTNLDLITAQIKRMDMDRIGVAAALLNVFNFAIQVQAGRNDWTAEDYAAFVIAMRAVDGIGAKAIDRKRGDVDIR